ncbi:hypothetical protein BX600DRAFT_556016 [Xylariales sp. PMI_506]|nr:hypothetical protein BX600DRAFT_556016 [Xylariales sp. PMI_506]
MSRKIDLLPTPAKILPKKLIVTSKPRCGTLSLYESLRMLGYRPYHMAEILRKGPSHMDVLTEALKAKYRGEGKPYGKAEFDKWFGDYDVLIEIPSFFLDEILEIYPDAKFMHTERDVNSWYKSMNNTIAATATKYKTFPMNYLRYFNSYFYHLTDLQDSLMLSLTHGLPWEEGEETCKQSFVQLSQRVRKSIPPKQLAVFKLEDGFGWEQICTYINEPIPSTPYPRGNTSAEFLGRMEAQEKMFYDKMRKAVATGLLLPALGMGLWYYIQIL